MKILAITWKDLKINFSDRNGILLMIVAPLILSAIIGASFGNMIFSNSAMPFDPIPVLLVNDDSAALGQQLGDTLGAITEVLAVTEMDDLDEARQMVSRSEARAAIYIPAGFTTAVQSSSSVQTAVEFYADPSATVTPNIVHSILSQLLNNFNAGSISAQVTVAQLLPYASTVGPDMASIGTLLQEAISAQFNEERALRSQLNLISVGEEPAQTAVSPFAFFAPSMGLLFLMFAMMDSTRSILEEEIHGTLFRLLATPISHAQLLLGKVGGIFFSGLVQFSIFVVASRLIFQLYWGESLLALALVVLSIVTAYTGLGLFIAAFAKNANQAAIISSVVGLVFAALGGNFVPAANFPDWIQQLSKLTINRWALDGLTELTINGGGLGDVAQVMAVLLGIGLFFFALAMWQFKRRIAR